MKRFVVHRTSAAPLSRTLGAIGFALALIALAAKRFGLLDVDNFILSSTAAVIIAITAILATLVAFRRIWVLGGPGLGVALSGMLLGILALLPPFAILGMVVLNPDLQDVSTDQDNPPDLNVTTTGRDQPVASWMNHKLETEIWPTVTGLSATTPIEIAIQTQLYPDIVSRRYRIPPGQLHVATAKAVETLGWDVVDELPPDLLDAPTRLQLAGTTPILGLEQDVAVRIRPDSVGSLLDVRSRSRTPLRDIAGNADRIRLVFTEIDRVLLETYGDLARLSVEEDDLEDENLEDPVEPLRDLLPLPGFKPYFEDENLSPDELDLNELEG